MSQSHGHPDKDESTTLAPDEQEGDVSLRGRKRRQARERRAQRRQEDLDWRKGTRQQDIDWRTRNRQEDMAWRQMEAHRTSRCAALHAAAQFASQDASPALVLELAEQFAAWIEMPKRYPAR